MLSTVLQYYFPKSQNIEIIPFGNGHINDTYKLSVPGMPQDFILQRINTNVFKDPKGIVDTHLRLRKSIMNGANTICIADLIPNTKGEFLTIDGDANAWRVTTFISDSYTIDVVSEDWQAYEAGKGYGWFAKVCSKLDPANFKEAIKDFHRLSFRVKQLNEAVANDQAGRLHSVSELVKFYRNREAKLSKIESLVDQGRIPIRVVHNDTKINNLLFRNRQATAVIDLDTVGPGILYYDYGDAIRTSANTALEDEKDLARVGFNADAFTSFTLGYMQQVRDFITDDEKRYFYLAPVLMTYIMGIRFLADYLNGDTYYKTAFPEHNLVRSMVQKTLIESMEAHEEHMKCVVSDALQVVDERV